MSTHLLLEAALRSLAMGALILATLRALRIEQVRAKRTAWLLALCGALLMPVLVGAHIGPRLLPEIGAVKPGAYLTLDEPYIAAAASSIYAHADVRRFGTTRSSVVLDSTGAAGGVDAAAVHGGDAGPRLGNIVLTLAVIGYCAVAAVLSLRLCAGVGFALRLRNQAERIVFPFDPGLDVRVSPRVATPVTIGSTVLLPRGYAAWDDATLRIVLSHERAHVQQGDFYVHALAGLHCALFWFNPFSWWLQRELAELGEALSDCAAVEHADSRASYAETLLAFATRARWPLAAVAMASSSNLSPRIERLLSDRGFERSFAPTQRLRFIAAGVVAMAVFASTSVVRATDTTPPTPPVAPSPPAPPNSPAAPRVPAAPAAPPAPKALPTPAEPMQATPPAPVDAHPMTKFARAKKGSAKNSNGDTDTDENESDTIIEHDRGANDDESVLAINYGHAHIMFDTGNHLPSQNGDYIYFQHNGKPYLIQDAQIIAQAEAMLAPMKALREQQQALGDQQRLLGAQQRILGSKQRSIDIVQTPEFKRQMAELQKTIKDLDLPRLTAQINQEALAEVQAHLGDIQARVGEMQSEFGAEQGKYGEEQGRIGEQQGKLGEQQARLGDQQRKIIENVRRQLKPIIEQAIRDGKGSAITR
jgi:beta-lactamase regulating signal transducer with metallopeptidase domain